MAGEIDISLDTAWKLYEHNLNEALPHVEELVESLGGKTVVTSDHGHHLGERASPIPIKEIGHPRGVFTRTLVDVPWLVIDTEERRDVTKEATAEGSRIDEDEVKDRLKALGY